MVCRTRSSMPWQSFSAIRDPCIQASSASVASLDESGRCCWWKLESIAVQEITMHLCVYIPNICFIYTYIYIISTSIYAYPTIHIDNYIYIYPEWNRYLHRCMCMCIYIQKHVLYKQPLCNIKLDKISNKDAQRKGVIRARSWPCSPPLQLIPGNR